MRRILPVLMLHVLMPALMIAQAPSGNIAHYLMDNTVTDIGGNGYDGTLTSTTAASDRFGNIAKATSFVLGSSTGQLPLTLQTAISNSFSFSFWFKTSMNANSSSQWFGGNAIVDAEMCGSTTDWGIALIDGGKVCMGIGNPDLTIKSTLNYNDDNWHFLTATRNQVAGTTTLYVDGLQVATTSGTTNAQLTAPTYIGLGRNPCSPAAMYTGLLDEIIVYDRALTSTEVTNLHNYSLSSTLPLDWVSFTGNTHENSVVLSWQVDKMVNNNHFEIEYNSAGTSFAKAATVPASDEKGQYAYTIKNLSNGIYNFRIKQVDNNGRYTFSKTIKLTIRHSSASFYLLHNPVNEELVIMNPAQQVIQQAILTDLAGRRVLTEKINSNSTTVKPVITGLKPGYYFITLISKEGNTTLPFIRN